MKQVLQQARTGEIRVFDVPAPQLLPGCVLVQAGASLVSAGTERAASEFARKSLFAKAKARPDLVRDVITKARRDGLASAFQAVRARLDEPLALGYSSAGTVLQVAEEVVDIRPGDRVACAGAGFAVHAEVACIPRLLVAKVADSEVPFEHAAFTTLGAVALHGLRTSEAKLGDIVAVIGLGLLGQLTVQLLKAAGCRVIGFDISPERAVMAVNSGAELASSSPDEFCDLCSHSSAGLGADCVLITAQSVSSEPVNLAARIARDRAIVVAVGTVGMDIERKLYYEKEINFRLSRSYGPGRYDAAYEQKGRDYPAGYVRWTETRNMRAFLQLIADGKLHLEPLITHRFPVEQAASAYNLITRQTAPFLGVVLTYPERQISRSRLELVSSLEKPSELRSAPSEARLGVLGAGKFAINTLLPAIRRTKRVRMEGVCSATGARARYAADKFGFRYCSSDEQEVLRDSTINTIVITTRHHLHGRQAIGALSAGKHVFCEKPLCIREEELSKIVRTYLHHSRPVPMLMVGFNRRFAPMVERLKSFLDKIHDPLFLHYRVNAGFLAADHWIQDPEQGGGRIIGEMCHFVDLLMYLAGSEPRAVLAHALPNPGPYSADNVVASMEFLNGSCATISYMSNGDRASGKERLEVFGGGATAILQDFRRLELSRNGKTQVVRSPWRQDKGHRAEWQAFITSIREGKTAPIPFREIVATTLTTFRISQSLRMGKHVAVDTEEFMKSSVSEAARSAAPV